MPDGPAFNPGRSGADSKQGTKAKIQNPTKRPLKIIKFLLQIHNALGDISTKIKVIWIRFHT